MRRSSVSKLRGRPPVRSESDFIEEAETPKPAAGPRAVAENSDPPKRSKFPWEESTVREDVTKTYLLRLPEPLMLKLKYISAHSKYSMNSFCAEKLEKAIERELRKITDKG